MSYPTEIVTSEERFDSLMLDSPEDIVVDVETYQKRPTDVDAKLLGVAVAFRTPSRIVGFYVPLWQYTVSSKSWEHFNPWLLKRFSQLLPWKKFIGHNIEFDRDWVDALIGEKSRWFADTRKMWHLADKYDSEHGFGLKMAQTKILGWSESNEKELEGIIRNNGGKLSDGDHYLAPLCYLGKYASLDAISTLLLFEHFKPFFDKFEYWDFLEWRLEYHQILSESTRKGTLVDELLLKNQVGVLAGKLEESKANILNVCEGEISILEYNMAVRKAKKYKTNSKIESFLADSSQWEKFNLNSHKQKGELLFDVLGLPDAGKTPTGGYKTDKDSIKSLDHPVADHFVKYSEVKSVYGLAKGYLESLEKQADGSFRIFFPYNTCGTVSDRLSGFKPYVLNLPFSEVGLMNAFKMDKGFVGVHADLDAIEPCLIAEFSKDPTLLKVHKDGLGDVYLDLALRLFPDNKELMELYNPNIPCPGSVKDKLKKIRDVCKIVHLAIGYTGTDFTIYKNVNKAGYKITKQGSKVFVQKYWALFDKVREFEFKLKKLSKKKGYLRNIIGRVLRIPKKQEKDTLNRFIQSGGHDILAAWVKIIDRMRKERKVEMYPVLPDIHDSTSWAVIKHQYDLAKKIFEDALEELNERLNISVRITADVKMFHTFAGLKINE